jgi:hypothetical protein
MANWALLSAPIRGVLAGLVFAALLGAFLNRFGVGLVIGCVRLPWPGWAVGLFFGLLLSLPDAIITKAYAPILILGSVGGLIIGGLIHGWRRSA